jgi:hypothetical protein
MRAWDKRVWIEWNDGTQHQPRVKKPNPLDPCGSFRRFLFPTPPSIGNIQKPQCFQKSAGASMQFQRLSGADAPQLVDRSPANRQEWYRLRGSVGLRKQPSEESKSCDLHLVLVRSVSLQHLFLLLGQSARLGRAAGQLDLFPLQGQREFRFVIFQPTTDRDSRGCLWPSGLKKCVLGPELADSMSK